MLFTINQPSAGDWVVSLDGVPTYLITKEATGLAYVLLACRYGEPRPTILAREAIADYLLEIAATNLRAAGHIAQVAGGVVVWLTRTEQGIALDDLGYLRCASSKRLLALASVKALKLNLLESRTALLSERMDAGDASFHPNAQGLYIPFNLKT